MSKVEKIRVRIRSRRDMTVYDEDERPVPTKEILYSTRFLTPSIVRIPLSEYTLEEEDKRVRADIDRRLSEKPEIREV